MKITGLRAYPLRLEAIKPGYGTAQSRTLPAASTVIIRVSTDAGVEGIGEAAAGTAAARARSLIMQKEQR